MQLWSVAHCHCGDQECSELSIVSVRDVVTDWTVGFILLCFMLNSICSCLQPDDSDWG